jgi:DeoR/GlpR family transcriptional regulator of sugar metabolism
MWLPEKRYGQILTLLGDEGIVKTSNLKERMDVSFETIRRDLEHLESMGQLRRTHGGAVPVGAAGGATRAGYLPFQQRNREHPLEKTEVAQLALQFISEGQSLALDSGTTSVKLAELIKARFSRLTVVTNSLRVASELADASGFTVIVTGGVLQHDEYSFTSDMATLIFPGLTINTFFLTTCGVTVENGVTYQRVDEIAVQNQMVEASGRTILIADSSKLGVNSLFRMCGLEKIHTIITDSGVTPQQVEAFERANVSVVHP